MATKGVRISGGTARGVPLTEPRGVRLRPTSGLVREAMFNIIGAKVEGAAVFASASPRETGELFAEGLVERPVALAYNRLTVIVPRRNPAGIASVADLARPGVRLSVAGPDVPVGAYAVEALDALGLRRALGNVVSREPDVKDVVGKVALGEVDAGIVYATDARAAETRLSAVPVPAAAQPEIRYEIAVVRGGDDVAGARRFVARATGPEGRAALTAAGFLPTPPS